MVEKPALHVAFNPSAANGIRQALRRIGCGDRVIGLPDDLSFGPIRSGVRSRAEWVTDELGFSFDDACRAADQFWTDTTSPHVSPVARVCLNHASEYAGFLEFVWRMAEAPFRIIDASEITLARRPLGQRRLWSLGMMTPDQIVEADLLAGQATLSPAALAEHRDLWQRLKLEDAPFRVIDESGPRSAAITHFDEAIMARITSDWQNGARVVGEAMAELIDRPFSQCPGDQVIWSRVLALADAGRVEIDGPGPAMRDHRVRLTVGS